jgi:hypothetical protein
MYIKEIKQLFLNDFRSASPLFTPTLNGLCRHVQAIYPDLDHTLWINSRYRLFFCLPQVINFVI